MDEDLDIIVEAKAEGEHQIRALKDEFDDLRRSVFETQAEMMAAVPAMEATSVATDRLGAGMVDLGRAGIQPLSILIGIGVALAAALLPLEAFTAGLAAALTMGTLVVGVMGLLGAGIVALAAHFGDWAGASKELEKAQKELATAQEAVANSARPTQVQLDRLADAQNAVAVALAKADNPLTNLVNHLDQMAKTLGQQAVPAATQILGWLDKLIPTVQELGSRLISWFGDRLPVVLPLVTRLFNEVVATVDRLGARVGPIFDAFLANSQVFERAFAIAMSGTVEATVGLINKVNELAVWWSVHGPEMERVAKHSLEGIGTAVQGLIDLLGTLTLRIARTEEVFDNLAARFDHTGGRLNVLKSAFDALNFVLGALYDQIFGPMELLARLANWAIPMASNAVGGLMRGFEALGKAVRDVEWNVISLIGTLSRVPGMAYLAMVSAQAASAVAGSIPDIGRGPHSMQVGGIVPGPVGQPRLILAHGGEPIGWYGQAGIHSGGGSGTVNNYTINVQVPAAANLADIGRETVRAIQEYERRGGKAWRQ